MTDKVLDFKKKREENIEKKRRTFERLLFHSTLGAYTVVDQNDAIYPIDLVDISHEGCLFQIPWDMKKDTQISRGHEMTLRMYFTKESYIPVVVNIKYGREHLTQDGRTFMQYGCEFDTSYPAFQALKHFIDFMYKYAEHSTIDHGDNKIFFL